LLLNIPLGKNQFKFLYTCVYLITHSKKQKTRAFSFGNELNENLG